MDHLDEMPIIKFTVTLSIQRAAGKEVVEECELG
jgi:hypothetical protein